MSLSPVSMVSFRGTEQVADTKQVQAQENPFNRPGAFSTPQDEVVIEGKPKKKSSFGKKLLYTLGGAAIVAAGLVALTRGKVLTELKPDVVDPTFLQKVGDKLAKAGEFIAKYTIDLVKKPKAVAEGTSAISEELLTEVPVIETNIFRS